MFRRKAARHAVQRARAAFLLRVLAAAGAVFLLAVGVGIGPVFAVAVAIALAVIVPVIVAIRVPIVARVAGIPLLPIIITRALALLFATLAAGSLLGIFLATIVITLGAIVAAILRMVIAAGFIVIGTLLLRGCGWPFPRWLRSAGAANAPHAGSNIPP